MYHHKTQKTNEQQWLFFLLFSCFIFVLLVPCFLSPFFLPSFFSSLFLFFLFFYFHSSLLIFLSYFIILYNDLCTVTKVIYTHICVTHTQKHLTTRFFTTLLYFTLRTTLGTEFFKLFSTESDPPSKLRKICILTVEET